MRAGKHQVKPRCARHGAVGEEQAPSAAQVSPEASRVAWKARARWDSPPAPQRASLAPWQGLIRRDALCLVDLLQNQQNRVFRLPGGREGTRGSVCQDSRGGRGSVQRSPAEPPGAAALPTPALGQEWLLGYSVKLFLSPWL